MGFQSRHEVERRLLRTPGYDAVFDALAALLPNDVAERQTLEQAFFGREILNILSMDGVRRVERHERHANWGWRLRAIGFSPTGPALRTGIVRDDASRGMPISVRTRRDGSFLTWKNRPLIAATAWTPEYGRRAA